MIKSSAVLIGRTDSGPHDAYRAITGSRSNQNWKIARSIKAQNHDVILAFWKPLNF